MKRKTTIIFIFMFVGMLFIIPNSLNDNLINAVTEQFDIKDTFETEINNRIYTEYNNLTIEDYAEKELNDAWDFNEGDIENFSPTTDPRSILLHGGNNDLLQNVSGDYNWWYMGIKGIDNGGTIIIDADYYTVLEIKCKTNTIDDQHEIVRINDGADGTYNLLSSIDLDPQNFRFGNGEYTIITINLKEIEWSIGDWSGLLREGFAIRIQREDETNPNSDEDEYYDYIRLVGVDYSDTIKKTQNTTHYRAYRGMKSYISNITNNYTYYEGFTANLNSSIKIDIPSLEFFPEKIQFHVYATKYFNLTLYIGDFSVILYQNSLFLDEWIFISKTINRENYLLNDTTDIIYFEISYNDNETIDLFYIDELKISYTEPSQIFTHDFDTGTGGYLDGFIYNTTDNYFHVTPSNEYLYSFSPDSRGIEYETHSSNLFSRRMFLDYTIKCDEVGVLTQIIQEIRISLDKEYVLRTEFVNSPYSYSDFNNRLIWVKQYLYVDGVLERNYYSGVFNDLTIDGFNDFDFSVRFQQEDYNTMSIVSIYNNKVTGNSTSFEVFAFNVNDGDIKNSITKMNVSSYINLIPAVIGFVFPDTFYHNSNPTITGKITREIKHSDVVDSNPDINLPVAPVWRGGLYALADIWNFLVYFVQLFIYNIIEFFKQSMYLRDIVKGIGEFFSTFKDYWTNLVGYLSDFITALGEIENIGDFISLVIDTIATHLENVFNTLVALVADIISSLGDIIDGELLGFPVLDDIIDAWEAFVLRDWASFNTAWKEIVPEITEDTIGVLLFIPDWFLSLWLDDTEFLSTLIINGLKFIKEIWYWMTILIIIYMVYFSQLIMRRDFDRIRIEVTTWVNVVNWIIEGITFVFHWIFEFLHAVLDVTIPFT